MLALVLVLSFLLLLLAGVALLAGHMFCRDAFRPPKDLGGVALRTLEGIPFLVENDLPYPAGIRSSTRTSLSLDGEWNFRLEGHSETSSVRVPSCFNTADSPLRDYEGTVIYARDFVLPAWEEGTVVRLGFRGSFYRTEVSLDGQPIGTHEGGYLPFYFDLTDRVIPHQLHRLEVRVDNRVRADTLPQRLFQGHNIGWHPYGGLHRSADIELCPPGYCFKLQLEPDCRTGAVNVAALFHAPRSPAAPFDAVAMRIVGPADVPVAEAQVPVSWQGAFGLAIHQFQVASPEQWSPASPRLYRFEVHSEAECCTTRFGFRELRASGGKLLLNGRPIRLRGICRHQEDRQHGLAQPPDSVRQELAAIRDLRGNFVRLAHYPHSEETLDLCDEMGLCAWAEIPLYQSGMGLIRYLFDKTKVNTGKRRRTLLQLLWDTCALENPHLMKLARAHLLQMIERDRNHPAVVFWSLGNECWSLNPSAGKALAWLRSQAELLDTSRLIGYAAMALDALTPPLERAFAVTDVVGVNEYYGWYYRKVEDAGPLLRALARRYPDKPLLVTETGADCVRGRFSEQSPPPRGYSEDYQAWLLEQQWQQMRGVSTFSGLSIWVLKDFLCPEYREDNPVPYYNLKGLFDRDGRPKMACETVKRLYAQEEDASSDQDARS